MKKEKEVKTKEVKAKKSIKPKKKDSAGLSLLTKIKIISILVVTVVLCGWISYLILSDTMLVKSPVFVKENAKITFVIGNVNYRENKNKQWKLAIVGTSLKDSYEIKTEKDSIADIRFHNEMAIRVAELSSMIITDLSVKKMTLFVEQGSITGKFEKLFKEHLLTVKTNTTVASIRGTELSFETGERAVVDEKNKKNPFNRFAIKKEKEEEKKENFTTVYAISGITEVSNPNLNDQKVLLAYQNKTTVPQGGQPSNPEKLTAAEIQKIRGILNSIHTEEVLLISDKINFTSGSAQIIPASFPELDKIALILSNKNVKIRIEGHTDNSGGAVINQPLSEQRSGAIREYLIQKGIKPEKLIAVGFGDSKPVADNITENGRAMNRRVEFIIVEE